MEQAPATVAVVPPASAAIEPQQQTGFVAGIKRIFGFIAWVFTGFGLVGAVRNRRRGKTDEIILYTVHHSFYLWMLILVGWIAAACVGHWPNSAPGWGWLYVFAMLYTI